VCLLATSDTWWFEVLNGFLGKRAVTEKVRILGGTASEIYNLLDQPPEFIGRIEV
jgi:hypothetical protein